MAFPFAKYPLSPYPHIQVWDTTEQLPAPTLKFYSTLGQGRREQEKKEAKSSSLPNTFDDDCGFTGMGALSLLIVLGWSSPSGV